MRGFFPERAAIYLQNLELWVLWAHDCMALVQAARFEAAIEDAICLFTWGSCGSDEFRARI